MKHVPLTFTAASVTEGISDILGESCIVTEEEGYVKMRYVTKEEIECNAWWAGIRRKPKEKVSNCKACQDMAKRIVDFTGDCPASRLDTGGWEHPDGCQGGCTIDTEEWECWLLYFEEQLEGEEA